MKTHSDSIYHRFSNIVTKGELNLSTDDPRLQADFLTSNIIFCIAAGILLCILSFIGGVGTFAPFGKGYVLSGINATFVYTLIFLTNLIFIRLLLYAMKQSPVEIKRGAGKLTCYVFMSVNMILANLTFYTTQKGSSFFFEYILVTSIVYLVPNSDLRTFIRNALFNVTAMIFVLTSFHRVLAWQDLVDIVALHIICGFVNWVRWLSFLRTEAALFSLENKKDLFYAQSRTDGLTGLLNRSALRNDFATFINKKLCVALMDLDSFKKYNDTFGHEYGDQILTLTGQNLKKAFHGYEDSCYRYGGDEFLVISKDNARLFHQKLEQFQRFCSASRTERAISCSIGYCSGIPHTETDLRKLIKIADNFLYQSKNKGPGKMNGSLSPYSFTSPLPMAEQTSAADNLKSLDDAIKIFEKRLMSQKEWSIAYLNVNRYAEINESIGYRNGELLLESIIRTIQQYFPDSLLIHREIDHFVLFSTLPDPEFTQQIRKIQNDVSGLESRRMVIVRAGVYHHGSGDRPTDFLTGMYNARYASDKANDAARSDTYLRVYDEALDQQRAKETFVHNHFINALEAGSFVPYYQPIVGSLSGTTCGFEALSRWIDPEKGTIPPGNYIPYLEESCEAYRLDLNLLEQVCRDLQKHRDQFPSKLFVNVNLSQTDFKIMDMPEKIDRIVSRYQIPREQIQFEITESAFAETDLIHESLKVLNERGYRVWMDDFGVGQSSLSAFHNYKVQGVKIDQSFFADIASPRTKIIIQSIIDLCHETNSLLIAEGVETQEQLWYAQQWGVNFIQGFYFSRPMPLHALLASSFIRNLTNETTDQFYQKAAEVNLLNNISNRERFSLDTHTHPLLFARAVLVQYPDQSLTLLRINDAMHQLLWESKAIDTQKQYSIKKDSVFATALTENIQKISGKSTTIDFPMELQSRPYNGRLVLLAQKSDEGMTAYLFSLSNFVITLPLNSGKQGLNH